MPLEVFGHGTVPLTLLNDEFGMCADYSDGTVHPDRQITRGTCHSGGDWAVASPRPLSSLGVSLEIRASEPPCQPSTPLVPPATPAAV